MDEHSCAPSPLSRLKDNPADEALPEADAENNDKKRKKNKTNVAVMRMPFEVLPWVTGACTEAQEFVKGLLVRCGRLYSSVWRNLTRAGQGP